MLVQSFLAWIDRAPVGERAEGTRMLAEAFLAGALGGDSPAEVEAALLALLDDPAPAVRRALALAFADSRQAPRHVVLGLAADQPEVSAVLIARSPLLTEADLLDLALAGDRRVLLAIALRREVTPRIAGALIARGDFDSAHALIRNGASEIAESDMLALAEMFGDRPRLREAMLERADLSAIVRHALMLKVAQAIGSLVRDGGFLSPARHARVMAETVATGTVAIARGAGSHLAGFVAHLRDTSRLTPAQLLRSVLGGDLAFITAVLADLCELAPRRVESVIAARSDAALLALLRRAGVPEFLQPALGAAVRAAAQAPANTSGEEFSLPVLAAAQAACLGAASEEGVRLLALLRRFEAEAVRARSRRVAGELRRQVAAGPGMLALGKVSQLLELTASESPMPNADNAAEREAGVLPGDIGLRGTIDDAPAPDLKTLIAEWKAERAALDRLAGLDSLPLAQEAGNQNAVPGAVSAA